MEDANPETRGRPSKFPPRISRIIRRHCIVNPGDSARVIKQSNNPTMSERSIQRFLVKNDFKARMTRPCMDISEVNRKKRVAWCERFQSKPLEYWRKVIFSDEKWFFLEKYRRHWVSYNPKYHSKEVLQCPKKRHPKKLMVWGCFSYHGCGKLYHCQKKVDSDEYCRIITTSLLPVTVTVMGRVYWKNWGRVSGVLVVLESQFRIISSIYALLRQ